MTVGESDIVVLGKGRNNSMLPCKISQLVIKAHNRRIQLESIYTGALQTTIVSTLGRSGVEKVRRHQYQAVI
jgi:hypothetical protein